MSREIDIVLKVVESNGERNMPLRHMKTNIVQSIRAHRVEDLQAAATELGHHFLYANVGNAQTKQDLLDLLAEQFNLPAHFGKNYDALYDVLTDPIYKSGAQPGFIVVIEHIPTSPKFDKEAREQLLDIFRDVADYWGDRKIPFRCFYSFAVARATSSKGVAGDAEADGEKLPTDKLVDVSPQALRMSSPFNAGYWLNAA
jgi:RNAse (barnase) inhibitor barstar